MFRSVTFDLSADAEPGLLARVLGPFARRDLVPDQVKARRLGDAFHAIIALQAMPAEMVSAVEGNLRQVIGMRRVEVVLRGMVRHAA